MMVKVNHIDIKVYELSVFIITPSLKEIGLYTSEYKPTIKIF